MSDQTIDRLAEAYIAWVDERGIHVRADVVPAAWAALAQLDQQLLVHGFDTTNLRTIQAHIEASGHEGRWRFPLQGPAQLTITEAQR